jgi:hypothetical protein
MRDWSDERLKTALELATLVASALGAGAAVATAENKHTLFLVLSVLAAGAAMAAVCFGCERFRRTGTPTAPTRLRARTIALLALCAVLVGGAAGYSVGHELPSVGALRTIVGSSFSLRYPQDWTVHRDVLVPGLGLHHAIALAADAPVGASVEVGIVQAVTPRLLPEALARRLARGLPRAERVRIGGVHAFRYAGLSLRDDARPLTIFVAPTTLGIVVIACHAWRSDAAAFTRTCERLVGTVHLRRGEFLALGPSLQYAKRLSAAIHDLDRHWTTVRARLGKASSTATQAVAARDLASALARAHESVLALSPAPMDRETHWRLVAALEAARVGYAGMARAAEHSLFRAYTRAVETARTGEERIRDALSRLERLGYDVAQP